MKNSEKILVNELIENEGERHTPCVLLLDTSGSMEDVKEELEAGVELLRNEILSDEVASGRVELSIVSFNDSAQEVVPFGPIKSMELPRLACYGSTHMHEAIGLALDIIEKRKDEYKAAGTPYYRPWIFMLTDGYPNDINNGEFERLKKAQQDKKVLFYGVAIGENADKELIKSLSNNGMVLSTSSSEFRQAFKWLSTSLSKVSNSTPNTTIQLDNPNDNPAKYGGQIVCEV